MTTDTVIRPTIHHVNLKTRQLQAMIDFYEAVIGARVMFRNDISCWMSNDGANHRIAFLAFPGFEDVSDKPTRVGLHHSAFEFQSFDDLNSTYLRLKAVGIEPEMCLDHGMTFSYYYADPDGNNVELQADTFGDWAASSEWMTTSAQFAANPIGVFVDPDKVAADFAAGATFKELHTKAMAEGYTPDPVPPIPGMPA